MGKAVRGLQLMAGDYPLKGKFILTIEGFSKIPNNDYSEVFSVGGLEWRLLIFPKGNSVDCLSIYLDVADSKTISQRWWSIDASFSIAIVNQIHYKHKVVRDSRKLFNESNKNWGFTRLLKLSDLHDPDKGYIIYGTCIIEAVIEVNCVLPRKKRVMVPQVTQALERRKSDFNFLQGPPSKSGCRSVSEKVAQSDVSSNKKSCAKGHVMAGELIRSEVSSWPRPKLFQQFGQLKVRNPPYPLPTGYRITEGTVLDEGDLASKLIQSALLSSELKSLVEMPVADLTNQGYYYLAKFLHCHSASMVSTQGLQIKHQEEIKSRDVEIQQLQLRLEKSTKEASQLRVDLEKVKDEKVKVVAEFAAAKEKIIYLEGELKHLCSENVDLQIQLEDSRQGEQNVATSYSYISNLG